MSAKQKSGILTNLPRSSLWHNFPLQSRPVICFQTALIWFPAYVVTHSKPFIVLQIQYKQERKIFAVFKNLRKLDSQMKRHVSINYVLSNNSEHFHRQYNIIFRICLFLKATRDSVGSLRLETGFSSPIPTNLRYALLKQKHLYLEAFLDVSNRPLYLSAASRRFCGSLHLLIDKNAFFHCQTNSTDFRINVVYFSKSFVVYYSSAPIEKLPSFDKLLSPKYWAVPSRFRA